MLRARGGRILAVGTAVIRVTGQALRVVALPTDIKEETMRLLLIIIVLLLLVGALPMWPYSTGWGYYPSGGLGLLLLIVIVLAVMGVV